MAVYKRPNSKYWWMKFYFDGELVQQSTKCSNKRDAQTIESAFRTQLALGKIGIEPKKEIPTFEQAVKDFLEWSKIEHSKGSQSRYHFACLPLQNYFGKVKVNKIETRDIEKYVIWRSSQKSRKTKEFITRETINFELLALKIIFKRLMDAKVLRDNPLKAIKQLSENERNFHVLSREEERLYLLACPQPLQDVAILMLETGMRCNEVYQLCKKDVFLFQGFLQVTKGKTKSSIRRVHLSDKAKKVLTARISKFDGENLFPQNDVDGEKATATLNHLHLTTIRRLGLNFRLYDCRHTFATRALESGVNLLVLSSILGHANLKMVSRYAHPSEQHKADAIRQMQVKIVKSA
jgi:integrase